MGGRRKWERKTCETVVLVLLFMTALHDYIQGSWNDLAGKTPSLALVPKQGRRLQLLPCQRLLIGRFSEYLYIFDQPCWLQPQYLIVTVS